MNLPVGRNCGKKTLRPAHAANAAVFWAKTAHFLAAIARRESRVQYFPQLRPAAWEISSFQEMAGVIIAVRLLNHHERSDEENDHTPLLLAVQYHCHWTGAETSDSRMVQVGLWADS